MLANARRPKERPELPEWCRFGHKPKMGFPTRAAARAYARKWHGAYEFHQYRCAACGSYHNTTRRAA